MEGSVQVGLEEYTGLSSSSFLRISETLDAKVKMRGTVSCQLASRCKGMKRLYILVSISCELH